MFKISNCLPLMAFSSVAMPAYADETLRLTPSSDWILSYDDEACRLMRGFGSGDDAVSLSFTKYAPGTRMEVLVGGSSLVPSNRSFRYRFLPSDEVEEAPYAHYGHAKEKGAVVQFSARLAGPSDDVAYQAGEVAALKQQEMTIAASVEGLEVISGLRRPFVLETGALDDPLNAFDHCLTDLVASWGFDPAQQSALRSRPEPHGNPGRWIGPNDYPTTMLRQERSGVVRFRLSIDEKGRPRECIVQGSFSDPAFQKVTCEALMRKASFKPAISAEGEPVASYWATAVNFSI